MRNLCGVTLAAVLATVPAGSARAHQAPFQPAGGFGNAGTPDALVEHPEVQKELKLSREQVEKIGKVTREVYQKYKGEWEKLRDLSPEERRQKQAELATTVSQATMSALGDVLQPGQVRRLKQIHLQQQGWKALTDPKIEKALRLTDDQKNKIRVIGEEAAKEIRLLFRAGAPSSFQEALKKVDKVRSKALEKGVALLTDGQKKVWQELTGEPFQVTLEQPLIRQPGSAPDKSPGDKP